MPIFRHANTKAYLKLLEKYAGRDNKMAVIRTNISISVDYSLFIAIMLSSATEVTLFIILGFEFLLNIHLCYRILNLRQKIRPDHFSCQSFQEEINTNLQSLVLNETIEVLVPLTYFATFLVAYYGPNSTILGGIRNEYWNYKKVEDIDNIMTVGVEMFILDSTSCLICGLVLYMFCRINLFQEYCKVIMQCWTIMSVLIPGKLLSVSNQFNINAKKYI